MAAKSALRRVLILADESAEWKIAGLRQLDRLVLSLNEFALQSNQNESVLVCVRWKAGVAESRHWLPKKERLTYLAFVIDAGAEETFDLVLNTHLFLYRNAIAQLINPTGAPLWEEVTEAREIGECEQRFLRRNGKSQDGLVSRYLNRPVSRSITRLLLKLPVTPSAWTLLIFPIPITASLILLRGSYPAVLLGLVLFQLFSILDGCDGEIARAKFSESERGRRLDDLCDILSNILLVVGLGFGLSRQVNVHSNLYVVEGLTTAALILFNELVLAARTASRGAVTSASVGVTLYPRHHALVERSGLLLVGEKFAWWLIQLTKRDVALLAFVVLAAVDQAAWILHLLCGVTAISLALALKTSARRSAG